MPNLAEYAVNWQNDRELKARAFPEIEFGGAGGRKREFLRSPFQHDRDRIIHSNGFRCLMFKTQVFVFLQPTTENFRTRLTHTIEVAQMARSLARAMRVDEDLTEAIALAHDLGHPPFGHAGERALHEVLSDQGGFDHNVQSFRCVTQLERRYLGFDGLNLTRASLEGIVKHNGRLDAAAVPAAIAGFIDKFSLNLSTQPSIEAQIAGIADDLAYNAHDLDDGMRAGLFGLDEISAIPLLGEIMLGVRRDYVNPPVARWQAEVIRRFINLSLRDVMVTSLDNLAALAPKDITAIAAAPGLVVAQGENMAATHRLLKKFLRENMYQHEKIVFETRRGAAHLQELFKLYQAAPAQLPSSWYDIFLAAPSPRKQNRVIADFIATGNIPAIPAPDFLPT
ncbi:MAG: dNTP triphosphohydrolase [Candidatus Symbiobacter sp.]|nr:dNTP triphosphohydrolase [Candidatus Symbiobacter sp.]